MTGKPRNPIEPSAADPLQSQQQMEGDGGIEDAESFANIQPDNSASFANINPDD